MCWKEKEKRVQIERLNEHKRRRKMERKEEEKREWGFKNEEKKG